MAKKQKKKKPVDFNAVGDRGERIAMLCLTDFGGNPQPLFRTCFLGEKWPTVDCYVEVMGDDNSRPFFFIQVKTSSKPVDLARKRLPITVSAKDVKRLLAIPAPTYVVGVDMRTERSYLRAVRTHGGISHVSLSRRLTFANLERLRKEVLEYWKKHGIKPGSSHFEVSQ